MKISKAINLHKKQLLEHAYLIRNPSNQKQWFIMLSLKSGERFLLANEEDNVIVDDDLGNLIDLLKSLGFYTAKITL